jgi:hypothetical protein
MRRVQDAEVNKEPWRIEAYNWLKERKSYRRDFRVLSD